MQWLLWVVVVAIASYLLGSIPTGYWLGKVLKGIDIREYGSKSTGATNVLRTLGKGPGATVLLVDVLKGVAAVLLTRWLYTLSTVTIPAGTTLQAWVPWMVTFAALAAMFGHSRSVWINFTGGKSVATGLGVLLAMCWQAGLGTFAVFGVLLATRKIVSLGSIGAAIAAPVFMIVFGQPLPYVLMAIAGGSYVIVRHRANIQRLLAGTEPQIGQKASEPTAEEFSAEN